MSFILYEQVGKRLDTIVLTEEEACEYLSKYDIMEAEDKLYCCGEDEVWFWVDTEVSKKNLLVCKL